MSSQGGSPMDWQYDTPPATKRSHEDFTEQSPTERPTRIYSPTRRIYPNTFRYPSSEISPTSSELRAETEDTEMVDVYTDHVYDIPANTDHVYDLPNAHSNAQHVYMSHGLQDPTEATAQPTLVLPAPTQATAQSNLVHEIGATIYNVTCWTGLCLAKNTYRVAAQVVDGVKRRAVETRVPRRARTPQEERREIIRASHRPLRSPRQRPSTGQRSSPRTPTHIPGSYPSSPTDTTGSSPHTPTQITGPSSSTPVDTTGSSPHTPTQITGSSSSTPVDTTGSSPHTPTQITGSYPRTPTDTTGSSPSTPTDTASASPGTPTAVSSEFGMEDDLNAWMERLPEVQELERRLILKWGERIARVIIFKISFGYPLTEEELDLRTPEEIEEDMAEDVAEDMAQETEEVGSSPLSSAPSSCEKYRLEDFDTWAATGFDSPQSLALSYSPLSSARSSIEKYRPASLDRYKFKLPKTPKTVAFHLSPTTGAPVTQVKRFIIGESMDYVEVSSPTSAFSPGSIAKTEAEASDSPIEHHIAHMERRRDAAVLQPIHNDAFPIAKTEAEDSDSPIKHHIAHMERRRKAAPLQPTHKTTTLQPTHNEAALHPTHNEAALQSTHHQAALHLTHNETALQPTHYEAALHPTHHEAALQPTHYEAALHPTLHEAALQPTHHEAALHTTYHEAALQSTHKAALPSTHDEAALQLIHEAALFLTHDQAALHPTHEAALQSTHDEAALQLIHEAALYLTHDEAALQPTHEAALHTTPDEAARQLIHEAALHSTHDEAALQLIHEAALYLTHDEAALQPTHEAALHTTHDEAARQPTHETALQPTHEAALHPTHHEVALQPTHEAALHTTHDEAARQPTHETALQPTHEAALHPTHHEVALQHTHEAALHPSHHEAALQHTHNLVVSTPVQMKAWRNSDATEQAKAANTTPMPFSISRRKTNARDTARKQKAEEARSARAAKEAEKKAREEEARRKREERRMPEGRAIKPLPVDWERRVDAAMATAGDGTRLAATSAGSALSRRDLGTVLPVPGRDRAGGWLNDEVVTGYLQAVVDHGQSTTASAGRGKTPKFYAFNTFFYSSIRDKGVESVRRWAAKGRIGGRTLLEVERVFVPVHENSHWTMVVVSPMARAIEYFDSLGGAGTRHVGHVKAWLAQELGSEWVEREWTVVDSPSPRQANGLDCGVFAVTTAKMITLGINPLAYGPEDIPVQRRRMVAELLNGGFVGDFEP